MTVGELKKAIEGLDENLPVALDYTTLSQEHHVDDDGYSYLVSIGASTIQRDACQKEVDCATLLFGLEGDEYWFVPPPPGGWMKTDSENEKSCDGDGTS